MLRAPSPASASIFLSLLKPLGGHNDQDKPYWRKPFLLKTFSPWQPSLPVTLHECPGASASLSYYMINLYQLPRSSCHRHQATTIFFGGHVAMVLGGGVPFLGGPQSLCASKNVQESNPKFQGGPRRTGLRFIQPCCTARPATRELIV